MRDPTSGTADCFNNYFGNPNNANGFLHKTSGVVDGYQYVGPFTYCQENINIQQTVRKAPSPAATSLGFISLGYLEAYHMNGENIAYNIAAPPGTNTISRELKCYGDGIFTWST